MGGKRVSKVLCAPDSFKETLPAPAAAAAMCRGVAAAGASIACDACPVADGGEGSLDVLAAALRGSIHRLTVAGPLGEPVEARYAVAGDGRTAVVELAEASGLALVPPGERDPAATTTYGTGELVAAAARKGCDTVILCVGGSATVDGGVGIVQALGGRFLDGAGGLLEAPLPGGRLPEIARVQPPASVPRIRVAHDVASPLLGPRGAAAVFGPQKGATPEQVERLEAGLRHLAALLGADPDRAGFGAAGGVPLGLAALCGAALEPGIDLVLELVGFEARCAAADLVLTGEGRLDRQSLEGKACVGVARAARRLGVDVIAIAGEADAVEGFDRLFEGVVSLAGRYGLRPAMTRTAALLEDAAAEVLRERARGPTG